MKIFGNNTNFETRARGKYSQTSSGKIKEIKLRKDPTALIFFTTKSADLLLHYEKNEDTFLRGYIRCLKRTEESDELCPYCSASGNGPEVHYLIPVYSGKDRSVMYLRVKYNERPGSLFAQLEQKLAEIDKNRKMLAISYEDWEHDISERDRPSSEFGKTIITAFLKEYNADNKDCWSNELEKALKDSHPLYSMEMLRKEIKWIREDFPSEEYDLDSEEEISLAGSGKYIDEESL